MKFACIECGGKVDGIIVASQEHYNAKITLNGWYSWTAELNGEHMSLDLFTFFSGRFERIYRKFSNGKCFFKNIQYLSKFDVLLVVFRDYSQVESLQFINEVKKQTNCIIVGARSQPFGRFRDIWQKDNESFKTYLDILNNCDLYIEVNEQALVYHKKLTKTPIMYMPSFYPYEIMKRPFIDSEKKRTLLITGDSSRPDYIASFIIAKGIQEKCPVLKILVPYAKGKDLSLLRDCNYEVIPHVSLNTFIKTLGEAFLVINWDSWWTLGRMPADAAAVGTPCLGVNADLQTKLYPHLSFNDVSDIDVAINAAARLFRDKEFYETTCIDANKNLINICNSEFLKKKFGSFIQLFKKQNNFSFVHSN